MFLFLGGHAIDWRLVKRIGPTHHNPEGRRSRSRKRLMDGERVKAPAAAAAPPDGDRIGFTCSALSLTVLVRGSELFPVEMCGFGCSDCKPFQNKTHQLIKVDELFSTHRNKILSEKFLLINSFINLGKN